MNLELCFRDRTQNIYDSWKTRFREKRDKRGRVIQVRCEIPFALGEMRLWLKQNYFGAMCNIAMLCPYCSAPLDVGNFQLDHKVPASRGGGLGLDNLEPVFEDCNRLKGKLLPAEFKALLRFVRALSATSQGDILGRLKMGAIGMRMRHFGRKEKATA